VDETFRKDLQQQIDFATADRERLKQLVIDLLKSKSPEESRKLLEKFAAEDRGNPATSFGSPRPSPSPARGPRSPSAQNGPRSPSPKPHPRPTSKPSPKPSSPSPSPTCLLPRPHPAVPCL
jgi:hypothetical protein